MAKQNILIVEDEKHIAKLVKYNLDRAGYECVCAASGEEGLGRISKYRYDLVILDLMLPGVDGLEICRKIKQDSETKEMKVIMLTAKGEEVDRIVGLELGADDYVVKPFSPRELVLRVKAVLKRGQTDGGGEEILREGVLCVDIPRHRITLGSKEIIMTPMEFRLLETLMRRRGRVQSREVLLADVWDIHSDVSSRTIDTHVKRLREKLGKSGNLIETVTGIGYRFRQASDED